MKILIVSLRAGGTKKKKKKIWILGTKFVRLQGLVWMPQQSLLGFLLGWVHVILFASRGWPSELQMLAISASNRFALSGQVVRSYAFHARFWISLMTLLSLYRYQIHSNINMMNRSKGNLYFLFQTIQSFLSKLADDSMLGMLIHIKLA